MKLNPRKTPQSITEPLTESTSLKISYSARNRFSCWRRTYLGKFSSRTSTGSGQAAKIRSTFLPTSCSFAVRNFFMVFVRSLNQMSWEPEVMSAQGAQPSDRWIRWYRDARIGHQDMDLPL